MKCLLKFAPGLLLSFIIIFTFSNKSFSVPINNFIDNVNPLMNAVSVNRASDITIVFAQSMNTSTLNNLNVKVFGYQTGLLSVILNYNSLTRTLRINPVQDMKIGEVISITLSEGIKTEGSQNISPFVYTFRIHATGGNGIFIRSSGISNTTSSYLKSGDIDRDGDIDILVTNKIYKNDGHAVFEFFDELNLKGIPELADFDNDGDLDILLQLDSVVYFYSNNGEGIFTQTYDFTGGVSNYGDLNGDGYLDIVFYLQGKDLQVMKNLAGVFTPDTSFTFTEGYLGEYRDRILIDDFNNDGALDLIGIHGWTLDAGIFYLLSRSYEKFNNIGKGRFSQSLFFEHQINNIRPDVLFFSDSKSSDINNDGYVDIISPAINLINNGNMIFTSRGNSGFTSSSNFDFNGNGFLDIAATDWGSPLLTLTNDGSGNFALNFGSTIPYDNIISADFDNDGDLDIVATNPVEQEISILLNSDIPSPVELSSFTSNVVSNIVILNWTTATEENNSGFDVERQDSKSETQDVWAKIGNVNGNGTSSSPHSYLFTDKNLNSGKYKYRLKQIDFNGNFEYHNLSGEVVIGVPDKMSLSQNYPNPFNPTTDVRFGISRLGFVSLKVYNELGREIITLVNENKTPGNYEVKFDGNNLSSGMYFYRLSVGGNVVDTKRMILVK